MPADSEAGLPRTFRPLGVRLMVTVLGVLLLAVVVVMWLAFPPEVRDSFTLFDRATVVVIGLAFYTIGYALARSRVVAREHEVVVVNGYRTRRFHWNQVLAVTLRAGAPWAVLDLSDGTSVAAMGIQASDGDRAVRQVREVRRLVDQQTR